MRITRLKRITLVIIFIFLTIAILSAFFRGIPRKIPDIVGMALAGLSNWHYSCIS